MKTHRTKYPTFHEWFDHLDSIGIDPNKMNGPDLVESFSFHRKLNGEPVTNVWATILGCYIFLTIAINIFPDWFPNWVLTGFTF